MTTSYRRILYSQLLSKAKFTYREFWDGSLSTALKTAVGIAYKAHIGAVRRYTNEPFIEHPVRVADLAMTHGIHPRAMIAAILHDTLEDTEVTEHQLRVKLDHVPRVVDLVVELTNTTTPEDGNRQARKEKDWARISKISGAAKDIKALDRYDNLKSVILYDPDFAKVYVAESEQLLNVISKHATTAHIPLQELIRIYRSKGE